MTRAIKTSMFLFLPACLPLGLLMAGNYTGGESNSRAGLTGLQELTQTTDGYVNH